MIRFDIVVPIFNRAHLIGETLQALLTQTYPNWNAYLVDDGSADNSIAVAWEYAIKSNDRITVASRPNSYHPGGSGARNYGASLGTSDYLIFLDSDDVFNPEALADRAEIVAKYPNADMVVFPSGMFHRKIGDSAQSWNLLNTNEDDLIRCLNFDIPWCISGPVWKRSSFEILGGFIEEALSWQDWEISVRALNSKFHLVKMPDSPQYVHHYCRVHEPDGSISTSGSSNPKIENRLGLYRKIIPMLRSEKKALWGILNMCYLDAHKLGLAKFYEGQRIMRQVRAEFPPLMRWWWSFNEYWLKLMACEVRLLGRLPVPKPANRLYRWHALRNFWLGMRSRTFRHALPELKTEL